MRNINGAEHNRYWLRKAKNKLVNLLNLDELFQLVIKKDKYIHFETSKNCLIDVIQWQKY